MKVIILSAKTGNGHNTVMNAIYNQLKKYNIEVEKFDDFYEKLLPSNKILSDFYNLLQATSFEMCKLYTEMSILKNYGKLDEEYQYWKEALKKFFSKNFCEVIISTTPLINYYVIKFLNEMNMNIKFYTVITDPFDPIYPGFDVVGAYKYLVPNEEVKNILIKNSISEEKIIVTQYPLNLFDEKNINRDNGELSINKGKKTILINCGAQGSIHYLEIIRKVYDIFRNEINIIVICGKNKYLYNMCKNKFKVHTLSYVNNMKEILRSSDLCITKAGANTFHECLYTNTPVIIDSTKGLLYQEKGVVNFLKKYKVGSMFENLSELELILKKIFYDDNLINLKNNIKNLNIKNGSIKICEMIIEDYFRNKFKNKEYLEYVSNRSEKY